jgi:hypothetical protein
VAMCKTVLSPSLGRHRILCSRDWHLPIAGHRAADLAQVGSDQLHDDVLVRRGSSADDQVGESVQLADLRQQVRLHFEHRTE